MKRMRCLLYPQRVRRARTSVFPRAILLTAAVVVFAGWLPQVPQRGSVSSQRQTTPREATSYDKWLNEEVVYIISNPERVAFQKLKTDEERTKFVEQFWEQRNPNPGSKENMFKEEFYRRLAYANQHFASDTRAGWKTDCGHMYILYGPPDEIDAHPENKPYPFQVWKYRHIAALGDNVSFTFSDRTRKGDYQLTPRSPQ